MGLGRTGCVAMLLLLLATPLQGQAAPEPRTGPVLQDFGPVYEIEDPDFLPTFQGTHRVVFDVAQASPDPHRVNPRFETLARYLNMHAAAGVPLEEMKLALVVHGGASWELVDDASYQDRFGMANPNLPLLEALDAFGVQLVICGQSQSSRGIGKEQLAAPIQQALSAMTALVDFQTRGYQLIAF